jgi:hypothetical protein
VDIFGRHRCRGRPFSRRVHYDLADAFRSKKVINEPDFLPLHGNGDVARIRRFPTRAIIQEQDIEEEVAKLQLALACFPSVA